MIEAALPAARTVHFATTLLIEGCVVFEFCVARGAARDVFGSFSSRSVAAACILAVASGIAWWLLLAAEIGGSSLSDALADGTAWTLLTQTQFGWSWIARAGGFVLLATAFFTSRPRPQTPGEGWRTAILVALSVALTGSLAWSGHGAATTGNTGTLHLAADILHLIASGIWLGGLLPYAALLLFAPQSAAQATRRFSQLATASVLILLPTGIINGWTILPSLDALTGTLYGKLLLAKIALFLLMLAFAGVNRFLLTPRLRSSNSDNARSRLVIHSGCEIALGLAILAIVGVLGTLTPMRPADEHRHEMNARGYSVAVGSAVGPGPRSGRSSIAIKKPMPQAATKAQAANT